MRPSGSTSMAVRIGVALLACAIVPLGVLGVLVYVEEASHERAEALETLTAIANLQVARVEAFEQASIATARQVAGRTDVRTELAAASDGGGANLGAVLRDLQEARNASPGVLAVSVAGRDGVVVSSTDPRTVGEAAPGMTSLGLRDADGVAVDVLGPEQRGTGAARPPRMRVSVPVALGGRPVGAVSVEISLDPLVALAGDHRGLGETGETALVVSQDGDALFITPLRFDPDAQFARTMPAASEDTAAVRALRGPDGLLADAVDYRGEPVLAATRHLPTSGLGLVVKVDHSQAFAPIGDLVTLLLLGLALAVVVAAALAWVLGRRLARPIRDVEQVAARIGRGDLDARADTDAPGELGELAATLNHMASQIEDARMGLESKVAERTAELRAKLRELELRNEELDAFSSAVAHDLKSPLSVIKGALELVQSGRVDGERAARMLEASAHAAERMHRLIDDLLVLARTGVAELGRDDVSLEHMVRDVVESLDIGEVVQVGALPIVTGDRQLLQQALQNLLDNAARYAGVDGATPVVRVSAVELDDGTVAIAVDDDGRGIPLDEREAVFRPFTRGSTASGTRGTGVGLAIVARIAERHGGEAIATDSPLGGTRMLLTLPQGRVLVPAEERATA